MSSHEDPAHYSALNPPLPAAGERLLWTRLFGASKSLAIAEAVKRHDGLVVVVTGDTNAALQLGDEIPYFADAAPNYHLPDWEILPYDQFSPYQDIISDRIATLSALPNLKRGVLIVSVATLMHRVVPRAWLAGQAFELNIGDRLDRDALQIRLVEAGYRHVSQVMDHGDFAVRGSLIDIFAMGADQPFRIDLFDDEIETLRLFDAETQRSLDTVETLSLMPARETPLNAEAIARFKRNWRLAFDGLPTTSPVYKDISEGLAPAGIEYYLPLFFDKLDTFFDYLPPGALFVVDEGFEAGAEAFMTSVDARYEQLRHDIERPILAPEKIFLPFDDINSRIAEHPEVHVSGLDLVDDPAVYRFNARTPIKLP
ncbi:MAG: transcription-repair coupling factor, partial [Gammaproteobacteria bacterium]